MLHSQKTLQAKGIIFDLDGTLANTHLDFNKMCQDAGLPTGTRILEHCASLDNQEKVSQILSVVEKHELNGANKAEWILDAEETLARFYSAKIPMAIVTRNMRAAAKITVDKLSIPIELVITREDCLPKPDPAGLLMVSEHWNIAPEQLVYVGDFKFDLMAARNAGLFSCLILNQRNDKFCHMADKVITNFKQLDGLFDLA